VSSKRDKADRSPASKFASDQVEVQAVSSPSSVRVPDGNDRRGTLDGGIVVDEYDPRASSCRVVRDPASEDLGPEAAHRGGRRRNRLRRPKKVVLFNQVQLLRSCGGRLRWPLRPPVDRGLTAAR